MINKKQKCKMKYLKTYENWWENKIDGYVINGFYFAGGFKEYMFLKLTDEDEAKLSKIGICGI